jgi:hypothetical protein
VSRAKLELIAKRSGRPIDDVIEMWVERAAIREYEGGAKRADANAAALIDVANICGGSR